MSGEMLQHVVVTLIALLAMVVIVRRVAGFIGVRSKPTHCACPSNSKGACGASTQPASATPQPLIMLKPSVSSSAHPPARRLG